MSATKNNTNIRQDANCRGCIYFLAGNGSAMCGYLEITGESRVSKGCKTSGDCIRLGIKKLREGYVRTRFNSRQLSKKKIKIPFDKAAALYREGNSDVAVAQLFGVSTSYMQKWRQMNGVPAKPRGTCFNKEKAVEMMLQGYGNEAISKVFHTAEATIKKLRKSRNIPSTNEIRKSLKERMKNNE